MRSLRHILGLATLLGGLLGGWYLWSLLETEDPQNLTLTLIFNGVEGLSVGAPIKYRGVPVGEVRAIRLGRSGESAEVLCDFVPSARPTLHVNSKFWIVRPRFLGVTRGASGLETLVKDSYVAYTSPPDADPLPLGSRVPGLETPPLEEKDDISESRPGDLEFTVLFAESRELAAGSPVRYRGLTVGVVTSVELAPDESCVVMKARVDREHREPITDRTKFWIARPSVAAGWITGVDVYDLDALLGGPYLTYFAPPGQGTRAPDDTLFVGLENRPEFNWPTIDRRTPLAPDKDPRSAEELDRSIVTVHTSFLLERWYARDRRHSVVSPGILYRSADGLSAVVVARSGVDPRWWRPGNLGRGKVTGEEFRVQLSDGSVFDAGRVWIAPGDEDLAVLLVEGAAVPALRTSVDFAGVGESEGPVEILSFAEDGTIRRLAATLATDGTLSGVQADQVRDRNP
jgi:hypothetical protein